MGQKKIKKRGKSSGEYVDPNLDEVDEDRGFEVELDEESNEIVFIYHYRRKWEDQFDADIEHILNMEEANSLIGAMLNMIEIVKNKVIVEKSTPIPVEGNPAQGPNYTEGK
jgi:hypothetical protein